ncbi:MAG: adenosylcobinamide-GDP ribazoletransferase [Alphaproteobacteria bacterium]|nr:adenosylcobinamide-GDP ribazoletransferase [Alphaproteobacteria bacterium]
MNTVRHEWVVFLLAVQFLTRLPVEVGAAYTPERLAASVRYYPAVGALVGLLTAAAWAGALTVFPPLVASLLSTALGLLLTGAFHEDGLADLFDGIGGGRTAEASLAIMRDSRIGTFGTVALVMVLGIKVAALAALPPALGALGLLAGHALSRLAAVATIATSRYVREEGAGRRAAEGLSLVSGLIAGALGAGAALPLFFAPEGGLGALGAGVLGLGLGATLTRRFYEPKLGGHTGDCLGAVQQVSEIGFLLGLLAWV